MIKTSVGHKMQQKRDIILEERNKVPYSKVPNERTYSISNFWNLKNI